MKKVKQMPERLAEAYITLQNLPSRMEEYTIFQETMMRRQAQVAHGTTTTMDAVLASAMGWLCFCLILGLLLLFPTVADFALPIYQRLLGAQLEGLLTHLVNEFPWQTRALAYGAGLVLLLAARIFKKHARTT